MTQENQNQTNKFIMPADCGLVGLLDNKETFNIQMHRKKAGLPFSQTIQYGECGSKKNCITQIKYRNTKYCINVSKIIKYKQNARTEEWI